MTGLQKQLIPVQLGQGIDGKTDKKHVLPGKLLLLQNMVFKKKNRLDKRNGYRALSRLTVDGTELPQGTALEVFKNELLQYADQTLYSYSPGIDRWVSKGGATSAIVRTRQIVKNTATQSQADSAYVNGVAVYAWEDSRGGVRASVIDDESGAFLLNDVSIDASASRVRCLAFGSYLFVFYYKSGSLYVRRLNPAEPTAFDTAVTVSSTVNTTNPTYDVYAHRNLRIMFAHNVEGATETLAGWLDDNPAVLTGVFAAVTIAEASTNCLGIVKGPNETFYLTFFDGTDLRCGIYNNGLGQLYAPFDVETAPATNIINVTGYKLTDNTGVKLLYEVTHASTHKTVTRQCSVLVGGTAGTPADFLRSVGLASKAFTYTDADENESHYVALVHESTFQSTYFVARSDGVIIAKQQYALADGLTSRPILSNVWTKSAGLFAYSLVNKTLLVSENATLYTPTGIAKTTLDFTNEDVFTAAELGDALHIVGGVLQMYDGQSVVEHGFHLYPENLSASQSGAAGVAIGTYQYIGVYEWTDNYGRLHRSAPSVPLSFSVTGSARNVAVVFPTLRLTSKCSTRTNVSLALYRTEDVGAIFYRVSSIITPTLNDVTVDSVTITDTTADATLISNEILYTTGDVLEHLAPPACSHVSVYKNRLVVSGLEDENEIWFSKEVKKGEAVAFSEELKKTVDPSGGPTLATHPLDDKLLILKKDRYFYTYGDGPNNTGTLGEFAEPSHVSGDVGLETAQSLITIPNGVMLKTAKGLYVIDSTMAPYYLGAAVEDFNDLAITSAALVSDRNQIRFTTATGVALVYCYDPEFQQWSTFTAHAAKDAVIWMGNYVLLRDSGAIWKEDPTLFKDAGSPIRVAIGTSWLAMSSAIGWQRVYKIALLGEYLSPHKLRVSVGYDYSSAYTDTIPFNSDTALDVAAFGDGATYGADEVYGGVNDALRLVASLRIQKCQSIRLLIEEETTSATSGSQEAFNISTIGLLVGGKSGMGKFRSKQNVGTT